MRYLSALEKDRRGIHGRLGRYGLCRICCHSDIGSVGGRACGKKRGNSARRWEASPSLAHTTRVRVTQRSGQATKLESLAQAQLQIFPAERIVIHEHRRTFLSRNHHVVTHNRLCAERFFFSFSLSIVGIALRSHGDASGASAPASARAGKGAAGTRPRAHKARAGREEAHYGHQEECQGGTNGALLSHLTSPPPFPLRSQFC